jgi:hypothetical protein
MAKDLNEIWNSADLDTPFESKPFYSPEGDCVFYHFENTESFGDRIDDVLTVYRAFSDERVVGCQIKGVSALVPIFGQFGYTFRDEHIELGLLFLASSLVGQPPETPNADRRDIYMMLLRRAGGERIPARDLQSAST